MHGAVKAVDVLSGDLKGYDPALFFNGAIAISSEDFAKVSDCFCRLTNEIIEIGKNSKNKNSVIFLSNNLFTVVK